jgi:hypothetical protein
MPIDPKCPKCGGTGHIIIRIPGEPECAARCHCLTQSLNAQRLGWLNKARTIKSSPLASKLKDNVFILASDDEANPHLKFAFTHLGVDERWCYLTDSDVLQAWLGKPNPAKAENIQDLAEYPFLVIRLGVLGYKNQSMPGVLCELLQLRGFGSLPTWLISHRELRPDTCLEYSPELELMIGQNYTKIAMAKFRARKTESAQDVARGVQREAGAAGEMELGEDITEGEAAMKSFNEPKDQVTVSRIAELNRIARGKP